MEINVSDCIEVDTNPFFQSCAGNGKVTVRLNEHTYRPQYDLSNDWLSFAYRAFRSLRYLLEKEDMEVKKFVSVGSGCGIDVLGAINILGVQKIIALDIHPRVLPLIQANVVANLDKKVSLELEVRESDVLSGLATRDGKVDLIYENLPNLPLPENDGLLDGIKTSSFVDTSLYSCPPIIQKHLLTLHFQCLIQARHYLAINGSVINSIGGRIPRYVLDETFHQAGYHAKVLVLGLKPQTEIEEVLPGYVLAENSSEVKFSFYRLDNFTSELPCIIYGYSQNFDEQAFLASIEAYKVNATEALALYRKGIPIGHTVYMFRAKLKDGRDISQNFQ